MSSRSCETAGGGNEHRRDEHTEENSQLPTAQKLLGFVTSQTNPLAKYVEEITNHVLAVVKETEKVTMRCHKEAEEYRRKLSELEMKILHSERNCERYRKERNELRQRESGGREVQQLNRELAEQKHKYDQDYKEWEKKLKDLEETNDAIIKDQKLQIDQAQRDLRHREADVERLKEKIEDSKFGFSEINLLRKKLEDSQKQLNDTNDKLRWVKTKLKETEKELDDTKTRLSKAMGDKLTDNNPNIADLSDKNRPTKLAEKYAELYDNQWTDAFETTELHYGNEEDVIEVLLKLLEDISAFCNRVAQEQMEKLKTALTYSDNQTDEYIPATIIKQLKDCRKMLASISKEHIYKSYLSRLRTSRTRELRHGIEIPKFVKECFEICWLMVIQDPPLVFASRGKGELLNTELYKPYTKNGKYVKFIVWPAMLLHKDGPVLAKGVAQGERGNQDKDKVAIDYVDKLNVETHFPHSERKFDKPTYTNGHFVNTSRNAGNADYANVLAYNNYKGQPSELGKERHRRAKSEEERRFGQPTLTKMSSSGTRVWKPYKEYDKNPTRDEMRTYFHYFDRREYSKAMNELGSKVYYRCMQHEHKRHMYVK